MYEDLTYAAERGDVQWILDNVSAIPTWDAHDLVFDLMEALGRSNQKSAFDALRQVVGHKHECAIWAAFHAGWTDLAMHIAETSDSALQELDDVRYFVSLVAESHDASVIVRALRIGRAVREMLLGELIVIDARADLTALVQDPESDVRQDNLWAAFDAFLDAHDMYPYFGLRSGTIDAAQGARWEWIDTQTKGRQLLLAPDAAECQVCLEVTHVYDLPCHHNMCIHCESRWSDVCAPLAPTCGLCRCTF